MQQRPVKLACRGVWKIYGPAPARLLAGGAVPDLAAIRASHHVGAVRAATLDVGAGEIFVIMGLSGSGKSTLVRRLSRLVEPTAGQILFDGRDLLKASRAEMIAIR
ncbi:MAG: ATP-binding cassette domain-containing protein, partial [Thermohalobaculum sp.]|nr:ATP-binding cassette domain-containing protein [Thermohalobaculum sp.]